jgi:hypothetical protein
VRRRAFLTVIDTLQEHWTELNGGIEDMQNGDHPIEDAEILAKKRDGMKKVLDYLLKYMEAIFPEIKGKYLFELTLQFELDGRIIYGTFDIYDIIEMKLWDYKVTSVYSYMFPESRQKWVRQLNVYAFLLRQKGYKVETAAIVAIFRDYSNRQKGIQKDYPERQIMEIPINIFDQEKQYEFIYKRLQLHTQAEKGQVPECTGGEMWSSSDEFVVKTKSAPKKALNGSRCNTRAGAVTWMKENDHKFVDMYIEERIGERRRCENYCPVCDVCPQFAEYKKKKELSHVIPE